MADASYLAQVAAFASYPRELVRLTIEGTSGNNVHVFGPLKGPRLHVRLGVDVLPFLRQVDGVATRIQSDRAVTDRGVRRIVMFDEYLPEAITNAPVLTGDTWWTRFLAAYPNWYGAKVEVLRFYDHATLTALSQAEVVFRGRLEDMTLDRDASVGLVVRDALDLHDESVPAEVGDDNTLAAAMTGSSTTIQPERRYEFTDSNGAWSSFDWTPVVVKVDSERIACQRSSTTTTLRVGENHIDKSEALGSAPWAETSVTVAAYSGPGPWGPAVGFRLSYSAGAGRLDQVTAETAAGESANFSLWLREDPSQPGNDVRLRIRNSTGTEFATADFTAGPSWVRVEVSLAFSGGAGGTIEARIENNEAGAAKVLVAMPQVSTGSLLRREYVRTDGNAGATAGRGAYGTPAASHSVGAALRELACYRAPGPASDAAAAGLHPFAWLRDLVNRGRVLAADVEDSTIYREMDFDGSLAFARVVEDPRSVNEILAEVRRETPADLWVAEDGKVQFRFMHRPPKPTETIPALTEREDLVEDSITIESNKASRITRTIVYWSLRPAASGVAPTGSQPEDFLKRQVSINIGAELPAGRAAETLRIFSRNLARQIDALALAGRIVARLKRGMRRIRATVSLHRDPDYRVGDLVDVTSRLLTARQTTGAGTAAVATPLRCQVVGKRFAPNGGDVDVELLEAGQGRYAFFGPGTLPDYNDPAITEADKRYGYFGDASGNVTNAAGFAEEGYLWW